MSNDPFELEDTQPINIQLLILQEIKGIRSDIADVKEKLAEHDSHLESVSARVNLAGNIAAEARSSAEEALITMRRIDQNLSGIYELAKSGYDIATAIKSLQSRSSFPPNEPESYPDIEFAEFKIVGTGN